jgi:hypothetical protein
MPNYRLLYIYMSSKYWLYITHTTNINIILEEFNTIHPKIKFTIEKEENIKLTS